MRILAAAHADEDGIAILDHVVIADRLAGGADQTVAQLEKVAGDVVGVMFHGAVKLQSKWECNFTGMVVIC